MYKQIIVICPQEDRFKKKHPDFIAVIFYQEQLFYTNDIDGSDRKGCPFPITWHLVVDHICDKQIVMTLTYLKLVDKLCNLVD